MLDRQCLKEEMRPADLARMVLFLASADSRLCTAQTYIVDAGAV
jgi:NAD(P)-dependent dehydrogenase (short-subunit alcohol dehydrogenase family)